MLGADLAQAGRAGLLAHLDQPFEIEAEAAAHCEHGGERRDVDGVLALVVGGAAAVVAAVGFDELPGRQARLPVGIEAADHVAVAVDEDGRQAVALATLADQERPARLGMAQHPAGEPERLERGLHLGLDVARKLARPIRVLALGRDGDAAREVGLESTAVEIIGGAGNGGISAHAVSRMVGASIMRRLPRR